MDTIRRDRPRAPRVRRYVPAFEAARAITAVHRARDLHRVLAALRGGLL
ncbi:hypothetical protein [Nocardiopsis halophila]|nr:hypothetical protein [Nocardiopsis halophila]